jgi:hypothetical protein
MDDQSKAAAKAEALAEKAMRREYDFAVATQMHSNTALSKSAAQYQVWRNMRRAYDAVAGAKK